MKKSKIKYKFESDILVCYGFCISADAHRRRIWLPSALDTLKIVNRSNQKEHTAATQPFNQAAESRDTAMQRQIDPNHSSAC